MYYNCSIIVLKYLHFTWRVARQTNRLYVLRMIVKLAYLSFSLPQCTPLFLKAKVHFTVLKVNQASTWNRGEGWVRTVREVQVIDMPTSFFLMIIISTSLTVPTQRSPRFHVEAWLPFRNCEMDYYSNYRLNIKSKMFYLWGQTDSGQTSVQLSPLSSACVTWRHN